MNSKRLQQVETMAATLVSYSGNRVAKVFAQDDYTSDEYKTTYKLTVGYIKNGIHLTPDYEEEFQTIQELEVAMREFNSDLRKWQYYSW